MLPTLRLSFREHSSQQLVSVICAIFWLMFIFPLNREPWECRNHLGFLLTLLFPGLISIQHALYTQDGQKSRWLLDWLLTEWLHLLLWDDTEIIKPRGIWVKKLWKLGNVLHYFRGKGLLKCFEFHVKQKEPEVVIDWGYLMGSSTWPLVFIRWTWTMPDQPDSWFVIPKYYILIFLTFFYWAKIHGT